MTEINNKKLCESCFAETDREVCPNCGFSKSEYAPDPLVLPMGAKLNDKIIIGRVMGKGGFGVTYLGYDLRLDKVIAVKEYYPNGIAYRQPSGTEVSIADTKAAENFDKGAEKFYAEAEMVAQFNGNPNIVSVYDYFRENNTVYLVMEYISGITLKNYIKKHGKLTDGQALYVMDKIAGALSITHSAGVLHRDISPDNIMICKDGKVKLIDFGAARQIVAESSSNLTVVLKPGYTPVEQYTKKGKQGAWTDIYSLGVSVYYALTEIVIDDPYARMDDDSELDANTHGINDDLWAILKKCTMVNASERYGSAIDLRKALKSVSTPIKSEPITLSDEDLMFENVSAAPVKSAEVKTEKKAPAETAAPAKKDTEAIEVFETGNSPPPADADVDIKKAKAAGAGVNVPKAKSADVNIPKAKAAAAVSPAKEKITLKKPVLIGICAAAVLIVAIIGIILAGNKQGGEIVETDASETGGTTSSATTTTPTETDPPKTETTETIRLDDNDTYWGMTKSIPKSALEAFNGDIKVTLTLEPADKSMDDDGTFGRSIRILDGSGKDVDVNAFSVIRNEWNEYDVNDIDEFVFVISHETAEKIANMSSSKISFEARNVLVSFALLEDYDYAPYKTVELSSEYPGDWGSTCTWNSFYDSGEPKGFISKSDLEKFGGDVTVYLDIEVGLFGDTNDRWRHLTILNEAWEDVPVSAYNKIPLDDSVSIYEFVDVTGECQFVFKISESEIKKLTDLGLQFQVHNVIVKSAALEADSKKTDNASAALPLEETAAVTTAPPQTEGTTTAATTTTTAPPATTAKVTTTTKVKTTTKAAATTTTTTTTTTAPVKIEKPLNVKLNDKYQGDWMYTEISEDSLKYFDGDVKITLDIEVMEKSEWSCLIIEGDYGKPLNVRAYNTGKTEDNSYEPFGNVNKFAFVVKKEAFNNTNRKVLMTGQNVWVKGATIEDYDPNSDKINPKAKIIQMDSKYQGYWNESAYIPKKELESFGGDVRVTLNLDILKENLVPEDNEEKNKYWVQFQPRTLYGVNVAVKADYICPCYWFDNMYVLFDVDVPDKFTFVISRSEIEKLDDQGLCFAGTNFVIKSAALEKA